MYRYSIPLLLLAYTALSMYLFAPPPSQSATTTALSSFSAERAMQHVWQIAKEPHSTGTAAHQRVTDYLVQELRQRTLSVTVQDTIGVRGEGARRSMSRVQNIIARLPGTDPTTTLVVLAHYDSQPNTPGAADDAAACAAILETVDALRAGPPLRNDVLFVITDSEEGGLFGAEAFVRCYPQLADIGLVLNFEARGNSGPSLTFEISPQNGWLMRQYARAAAHPIANSMTYEIYLLLPNDTDYTMFRRAGVPGLNQAFLDGFVNYHSMTDTPERLSRHSLQHHGSNMLSLVQHFGQLDWPADTRAPDVVFFNPIGTWLVLYPASWDIRFMLMAGILFVIALLLGVWQRRFTLAAVGIGAGWFVLTVVVACGLVYGINALVLAINPHYVAFNASNPYNSIVYFIAYSALGVAVFGGLYSWALGRYSGMALGMGAALVWLLLMVGLRSYLPTGVFMAYWPLLFFLLAQLVCIGGSIQLRRSPGTYGLVQALLLLPALGLWVPVVWLNYIAFSLDMPLAGLATLMLLLGMCIPVVAVLHRQLLWVGGLVLALLALAAGQFTSTASAQHPTPSALAYYLDKDATTAQWLSTASHLDDWTGQYFSGTSRQPFTQLPVYSDGMWQEAAPVTDFPATTLRLQSAPRATDSTRQVEALLLPAEGVSSLYWYIDDLGPLQSLRIDGQPIDISHRGTGQGELFLTYLGPAASGVRIQLTLSGAAPLTTRLVDRRWAIPDALLPVPLPADRIFGSGYWSNVVFVQQQLTF